MERMLMKDANDYGWLDDYAELIGLDKVMAYYYRIYRYFYHLPEGAEVEIARMVQQSNRDLFVKCVCHIIYEDVIRLQFVHKYRSIKKLKQKAV